MYRCPESKQDGTPDVWLAVHGRRAKDERVKANSVRTKHNSSARIVF